MNLHQIQIQSRWAEPHVTKYPRVCSECGPLRAGEYPDTHLRVAHQFEGNIWVCECLDRDIHGVNGYGDTRMCETSMGSIDANTKTPTGPEMELLDTTFPYIYICPDCREHNHRSRERTR